MSSDQSETAVSYATDNRRMSSDMSGNLSDKPDGTTPHAQVANACLPAGQPPNKAPIFITGVSDARNFLASLQATCPGSLTAQLKGERLMVFPSTADGFRAVVSALRSLDGRDGVSFHTFTLPEDRCVPLLVKNLGRGMLDSVIREELESLNICVQGVMQLCSGRRNHDPAKDYSPTPASLFRWRAGLRCQKCNYSPNSAACEYRWRRTWLLKVRCNASGASASDTRNATADTRPGVSRVRDPTSPGNVLHREKTLSAVAAEETTRRTTGAVLSGKRLGMPLRSKRPSAPERAPPRTASPHRKPRGPGPLPSK
jgi:hypothetical protein